MRDKPELQNIPAPKSAFHAQIKKLVQEHSNGIALLKADFSKIESRLLVQLEHNNA